MATRKSKLETVFTGDDRPFQKAAARVESAGQRIEKVGRGISSAFAAIGGTIAAGHIMGLGKEIDNAAKLAGSGVEEFQRFAQAARSVGIEQGKAADILKDMRDRIGDFLQTGGGPLADFFENIAPKVGVTAEQFRHLSGRQGLELFVESLQKANISQNEMVFHMEAVASDSSILLPLLKDNAAEMNRLGDAAEKAGRIMSSETVAALKSLGAEFRNFADSGVNYAAQALTGYFKLLGNIPKAAKGLRDTAVNPFLKWWGGVGLSDEEKKRWLAGQGEGVGGRITADFMSQSGAIKGQSLKGDPFQTAEKEMIQRAIGMFVGGFGGGGPVIGRGTIRGGSAQRKWALDAMNTPEGLLKMSMGMFTGGMSAMHGGGPNSIAAATSAQNGVFGGRAGFGNTGGVGAMSARDRKFNNQVKAAEENAENTGELVRLFKDALVAG